MKLRSYRQIDKVKKKLEEHLLIKQYYNQTPNYAELAKELTKKNEMKKKEERDYKSLVSKASRVSRRLQHSRQHTNSTYAQGMHSFDQHSKHH